MGKKPVHDKVIVVEVYDDGPDYSVVHAKTYRDEYDNHYIYIQRPNHVEFGDALLYNNRGDWFLRRGPHLQYSLILANIPIRILNRILWERNF